MKKISLELLALCWENQDSGKKKKTFYKKNVYSKIPGILK